MKNVSVDLFGISPLAWLGVLGLCLALVHLADQSAAWRDTVVRIAGNTLMVAGGVAIIALTML